MRKLNFNGGLLFYVLKDVKLMAFRSNNRCGELAPFEGMEYCIVHSTRQMRNKIFLKGTPSKTNNSIIGYKKTKYNNKYYLRN